MNLRQRDFVIFSFLNRFGFLNTHQIFTFAEFQDASYCRKRLKQLFDNGYLTRPVQQRHIFTHIAGKYPIVYGLSKKGGDALKDSGTPLFYNPKTATDRSRRTKPLTLEHTLYHADFFISLFKAVQKHKHARIIWQDEILKGAQEKQQKRSKPFSWETNINYRGQKTKIKIEPDDVFGIEFRDNSGRKTRKYFFVEIDSGSMPITRNAPDQSSILRKFYSYSDTHKNKLAKQNLKLSNFRVLFVTSNQKRIENMMASFSQFLGEVCSPKIFLFCDRAQLEQEGILRTVWQDANGNKSGLS